MLSVELCVWRSALNRTLWVLVFILILALISCGGEKQKVNPVPVPKVDNPSPPPTPIPTVTPTTDPRLPDLTNSVSINLHDTTTYSGLKDLAKTVFLPLVGDAKIKMAISGGRDNLVSGNVLIFFEDSEGFWGARLPSFDKTGIRTSEMLDMIFADDEFVIRVLGIINDDDILGNIFYRIRLPNENACKKIIVTCPPIFIWPNWYFSNDCNEYIDLVTPCRNYMDSQATKNLGTFKGSYSRWVIK